MVIVVVDPFADQMLTYEIMNSNIDMFTIHRCYLFDFVWIFSFLYARQTSTNFLVQDGKWESHTAEPCIEISIHDSDTLKQVPTSIRSIGN